MKILSSEQIRIVDAYTIENEPISSIDLMERAASRLTDAIRTLSSVRKIQPLQDTSVKILCGMGNNGGDGLVVARLLALEKIDVEVFLAKFTTVGSAEFEANLSKVKDLNITLIELDEKSGPPEFKENDLIVDSIFGSGLDRPIEGWLAELVKAVNRSNATVISIDMPSGLFCEDNQENIDDHIIEADHTLTLEVPKLSLLLAENFKYVGEWQLVPIGLDQKFIAELDTDHYLIDKELITSILRPRSKVAHKGNFGHALIIGGSYGKMGAAALALNACVRSGAGLTTGHIPKKGLEIVQISAPETMCSTDPDADHFSEIPDVAPYSAVGVGPGIGQDPQTANALKYLIQNCSVPLVLDADALNIIAENPTWLAFLPKGTILTPHPKEFERIAGKYDNDLDRLRAAQDLSRTNDIHIVLKGAYTAICLPNGKVYFNNTGNPGMATGGSGDVLTGIITGLIAQGYSSEHAAIIGVYWHGAAGDRGALTQGEVSLKAGDIVEHMGPAYLGMLRK